MKADTTWWHRNKHWYVPLAKSRETEAQRDRRLEGMRKYNAANAENISHKGKLKPREPVMLRCAKLRAKEKGLEFTITSSDIKIPPVCPLLGIHISKGNGKSHHGSPSLDRIDSSKGYVPGNVWVISKKANTIKNNASLEEFMTIAKNWANAAQAMRDI